MNAPPLSLPTNSTGQLDLSWLIALPRRSLQQGAEVDIVRGLIAVGPGSVIERVESIDLEDEGVALPHLETLAEHRRVSFPEIEVSTFGTVQPCRMDAS